MSLLPRTTDWEGSADQRRVPTGAPRAAGRSVQEEVGGEARSGARSAPAGFLAPFSVMASHHMVKPAHDGAGDEDQEDHEGADQQAQGRRGGKELQRGAGRPSPSPPGPPAPLQRQAAVGGNPGPRVPSGAWAPGDQVGPSRVPALPRASLIPQPRCPARPPKALEWGPSYVETGPLLKGRSTGSKAAEASSHAGRPDRLSWRLSLPGTTKAVLSGSPSRAPPRLSWRLTLTGTTKAVLAAQPHGHHQGRLPARPSSAAERHPHWGLHDPALISPLEPKRPRSDQGGRLGALGARPKGRAHSGAGLHCPGGQGLSRVHMGRSPLGCSQTAPAFASMGQRGAMVGIPTLLDSPSHPGASCLLQTTPRETQSPAGEQVAQLRLQGEGRGGDRAVPPRRAQGAEGTPKVGRQPGPHSHLPCDFT